MISTARLLLLLLLVEVEEAELADVLELIRDLHEGVKGKGRLRIARLIRHLTEVYELENVMTCYTK
jgi:hypothetical protein